MTNSKLAITPIPAFSDNYIWAVKLADRRCLIVDPGQAAPVLTWLDENQLQLDSILLTHQHYDHIDGVAELVEKTAAAVYGPEDPRMPAVTQGLADGLPLKIGDFNFQVISVPGHTRSHIAYYEAGHGILFCGDTLFSMGCGRLFEGTPAQMLESLDTLVKLPAATKIYCTHEYTAGNGRFALTLEPDNQALQQRCAKVAELRAAGQPSLPVLLETERQTNPFLRCEQEGIIESIKQHNPAANSRLEVFTTLRQLKDNF